MHWCLTALGLVAHAENLFFYIAVALCAVRVQLLLRYHPPTHPHSHLDPIALCEGQRGLILAVDQQDLAWNTVGGKLVPNGDVQGVA